MTTIDQNQEELLERIAQIESRGRFDAVFGFRDVGVDITSLTLSQVYDFQYTRLPRNQRAAGAYQFIPPTLKECWQAVGLDPETTLFGEQTQKILASYLLDRRGYRDWIKGRISTVQFQTRLAMEWAAIPIPVSMKGHRGHVLPAGSSYYAGVGENKNAQDNADAFYSFLQNILKRENPRLASLQPERGSGNENFNRGTSGAVNTESRIEKSGGVTRGSPLPVNAGAIEPHTGAYITDGAPKNIHFHDIEYYPKKSAILANLDSFKHLIRIHGDFSLGAGDIIELDIRSGPDSVESGITAKDMLSSGKYLITGIKHSFTKEGMFSDLLVQKDSNSFSSRARNASLGIQDGVGSRPTSNSYVNDPSIGIPGSAGGSPFHSGAPIDHSTEPNENYSRPGDVRPGSSLAIAENNAFIAPRVKYTHDISSKTRNKALAPELVNVLNTAAERVGVIVNVYSAGQDIRGQGTRRTGSLRHDAGYAADIFLTNGRGKISYVSDRSTWEQFAEACYGAGATAFCMSSSKSGDAPYMGEFNAHIDMAWSSGPWAGNPSNASRWYSWKGRNPPDWVIAAAGTKINRA